MLDALEAQTGLVRYALAGDGLSPDLDVRVTACDAWSARDLVVHLGTGHRWAVATVRAGTPGERTRGLRAIQDSAPSEEEGTAVLAEWYAAAALDLIETLTETPPDAPAWTFHGAGEVVFWLRRQLHETAVHRWDLEAALDGPAASTPLPEDVAVDAVDEFCTAMRPLMSRALPVPPATLRLRAVLHSPEGLSTGAEPVGAAAPGAGDPLEWVVPGEAGVPEIEVVGPPETLALMVWGRVGADDPDLEVVGDRESLVAALEAGLAV